MAKFKIGDRVKCVRTVDDNEHVVGQIGTIIYAGGARYGVEFDEYVHGHFCSLGSYRIHKNGHCWWCDESDLIKACEEKIVITTDGKTTTAKMYDGKEVVKTAIAKCSPEDEFDFETGAVIAFSRLFDADVNFVDDNYTIDWDAFKNDEFFVQVAADNFDAFIEEAEKHGCFFKDHYKFNPFTDIRASFGLISLKMHNEDSAALDGTLFVGYHDEKLKIAAFNHDNRPVIVW